MTEPTLYELSAPGRRGVKLPDCDVPAAPLPEALIRDDSGLPELSELDVVRHFQHLAQRNFGVDSGFYPLGSCTMKYNPRINEAMAALPGFTEAHPLADEADAQGCLALMHDLQTWLAEIGGFAATSLQPSAGAHGELTALLMMRRYHADHGEDGRIHVLIPDSAHGTNPASTTMAGLTVMEIPSDQRGNVDLDALAAACDETAAGLMLTNPNTLGLFEERVEDIVRLVHGCGALVYGDGANMNALTGVARPGDLGIDLMHYNLHKTFATPHGGGGPGSGPLAASAALAPYLPGPIVTRCGASETGAPDAYQWETPERSIGRMSSFACNFGMLVRGYVYVLMHGAAGLKQNAIDAVVNANYLRVRLADRFPTAFDRMAMHEFVCRGEIQDSKVRAIDICKRLMDFGFHPPTSYFPLTVREALMIEPTETESKETLDAFVDTMRQIADEAKSDPKLLLGAPHGTPIGRLDEIRAARQLIVVDQHQDRLE